MKITKPKQKLEKLAWLATTVLPALNRVSILLVLSLLSISSNDFAHILNIAALASVYLTSSIGNAAASTEPKNIPAILLSLTPPIIAALIYGANIELAYITTFCIQQLYRYIALANERPYQALISDATFLIIHLIAIASSHKEFLQTSTIIMLLLSTIYIIIITKFIKQPSLEYKITKKIGRHTYSGISNISTSGLIFAIPIILNEKLDNSPTSEATIIGTIAFIAAALPRAYVTSKIKTATRNISSSTFKSINQKLTLISTLSLLASIPPITLYALYIESNFIMAYGLLIALYTTFGQISSFNTTILMIQGDSFWLAKWNISIVLFVGYYYFLSPQNSAVWFLSGILLISALYLARTLHTQKKTHEWIVSQRPTA